MANNSAVRDTKFPTESFNDAYWEAYRYPSQGKRSHLHGVPSRPTLALCAAREALDDEPFESAIRSNTQEVLAVIIKLATGTDQPITEIVQTASSKNDLISKARDSVFEAFPEAEESLPENAFLEINYTGPIIVALCAVLHGIDPVETVRQRLGGETRYR